VQNNAHAYRRESIDTFVSGQNHILKKIAAGAPLADILNGVVQLVETQTSGICSILLLDEDGLHLRHGAAPSLPPEYVEAIDGVMIGPSVGSCGTAVYWKEPVTVTDIQEDPLWDDYRDLASRHGLRACWSTPIQSHTGQVVGAFAMYYRFPRGPNPEEQRLMKTVGRLGTYLQGYGDLLVRTNGWDPAVLQRFLADEPIASLDLRNATIVMDALRRINKEDGITVICNLHLLQTAKDYCDRIIGMRKGSIVFDGPASQLSDALAREIPTVQVAAPSQRGNAQVVYGNLNWATGVMGITPDYFEARDWEVIEGRAIGSEDVDGAVKVALLGQTTALNLFGDADPLGQIIRIKKVPFTVIGLLDRKGQNSWGQDQDDLILIPLTTAKQKVLGSSQANKRAVGGISVKIRTDEDMAEAEEQIRAPLRQRHRLQPNQDDDFWLRNLSELVKTQEESSRVMTYLLAAIASVSLLVGGIGIMNIMLVSVTERTREIGLRQAVGARGRDVLRQFLVEAIILSLIGGAIGIAVGTCGARILADMFRWPTHVSANAVGIAFACSAIVGIFFGYYPARRAAALDPIEALRFE
jgi:putative ABC transport system permease protein